MAKAARTGQSWVLGAKDLKRCEVLPGNMKILTAVIEKEDMYVARCPEIGTVSQGETIEKAVANLKEATELYLNEFPVKKATHPILTTFEVAEVARA